MERALAALKEGRPPADLAGFAHLCEIAGFGDYFEAERAYGAREDDAARE
jgi:hypothetical protein